MAVIAGIVLLEGRAATTRDVERLLTGPGTDANTSIRVSGCAAGRACADSVLEHACGDFAAAAWSAVERRLTLSRDVMGIVPLFVHVTPGVHAVFASDLHIVLAAARRVRTADGQMIARYMTGSFAREKARTFFAHVQRVPAGCTVTITGDGRIRRNDPSWNPESLGSLDTRTDGELEEELRHLLAGAVQRRMVDRAGIVGASLSEGLDSATIVGLVRARRRRGLVRRQSRTRTRDATLVK
jgi:asparagine synthetase B (glutamine-hydrolysing)